MPVGAEPTRAESEASEWLLLLDSPAVPQREIERFQAWLAASDDNKRAWAAVSQTWDNLGPILASLSPNALSPRRTHQDNDNAGTPPRARILARWAAPAAIAAGIAALVFFVPIPNATPPAAGAVAYATEARDMRTLALEDGSTIELSPLAEVRVAYSAFERRIELSRGTALFDVAADAERPFIVATPYGEVRVVGTAFAVRIGDEVATTSVTRGIVEGAPVRGTSLWARMAPAPSAVTAHAGEEIRLARDGAAVSELAPNLIERRLAWREGKIAADDVTLAEAAEEVTRFSGVAFEFADRDLARERVTIYLDGGDVDGFLALLDSNLNVSAERQSSGHMVLRRRG